MPDKTLVVVESPTKAKTIGKMLDENYTVLASYGHIYELLKKEDAIDPNNDFKAKYQIVDKNIKHVNKIVSAAKKSTHLILATDPDREGEAIAWNVCELLQDKKVYEKLNVQRCAFHQITKKAILEAIASPKEINMDLVHAQHTRRAMDFLLGFNLSPLLWRTVKPGTSAGRVQSPALHLIVSREKERTAFEKKEYWSIHCQTASPDLSFNLYSIDEKKVEKFDINNQTDAEKIKHSATSDTATIEDISAKSRSRKPKAPFTTSTLQQAAANRLGFATAKTMKVAQELYEGIEINGTQTGLITYMRTDSVSIASEAIASIRDYITDTYGQPYLPNKALSYSTKTKNAQEAHEAIRPSHLEHSPEDIQSHLSSDQFKLYQLIWQKTISSQMAPATIDTTTLTIYTQSSHRFKTSGSVIKFPGFLAIYEDLEKGDTQLPAMQIGEKIKIQQLSAQQHFTEPPPRYSEASLVKALEELGIGRPSTYATIISTLKKREYVTLEKKQFMPTDIAEFVIKFLDGYFEQYVNYSFTAKMEDTLDDIARGEVDNLTLLNQFWQTLHTQVEKVSSEVKRSDVAHEKLDEDCSECGKHLVLKLGKHGKFIGCSGYPECKYTRPLEGTATEAAPLEDRPCPKCTAPLVKKMTGTSGFYGCSTYPECKYIEPLEENRTSVICPKCNENEIIRRFSKRGKPFYGCSGFPKCKYALWNPPIKKKCPACDWPIMTEKTLKSGTAIICPECQHKIEDDN
ncbi:type I DNA topoisomerase [Gammaproteobacteria bacterium]|nr:type I DNA topoisomerase [Gammaproteobacteria bacterium]